MQWYYASDGAQKGPVSEEELKRLIGGGQVKPGDLAWHDGMPDWTPVSQIPTLAMVTTAPASPSMAPGPPPAEIAPSGSASPYQPPTAAPGPVGAPGGGPIPNYLWQAIVVTLLCCMPLGVAGIIFAAKVEPLRKGGDEAGAWEASAKAKKYTLIGFVVGLVLNIGIAIATFMAEGAANGTGFQP